MVLKLFTYSFWPRTAFASVLNELFHLFGRFNGTDVVQFSRHLLRCFVTEKYQVNYFGRMAFISVVLLSAEGTPLDALLAFSFLLIRFEKK